MKKTISNSEWEILEKLWDNGEMTIAQLEAAFKAVSYTHLRAHETKANRV